MPMAISEQQVSAVIAALSPVRLGTYLNAKGFRASATVLDIYVWNALVSSAMFASLHICEVVVRNGASQALELKYGANWPWEVGFERTLSSWGKRELQLARHRKQFGAAGRVIADLSLGFWSHLFTAGQDQHLWIQYLRTVFPHTPLPLSVEGVRKTIYEDIEALRIIRNRIAHHEPIFAYPLEDYQERIFRLVKLRSMETANWLSQWEPVSAILKARP